MIATALRTKLIPVLTIILCFLLWKLPLGLDYFEIILTTIVILISSFLEYKNALFTSLGFQKNKRTFKNLLIFAPLLAFGLFLIYYFILIPVVSNLTGESINFSGFDDLKGNLLYSIIALIFIWISAAFGEEIIWRGYFMRQFSKFFGDSRLSLLINIIIFAILFGFMHGYQGITGQIITGILGLLLAITFHLRKNDLWFNIFVHGFFDTIALIVIYNGWM
ncbi:type II CAAX endopeptidase family protein [Aquimarina sp. 2201CG5-10]|uniref:CPBP family intramembrane glutamic endopeptidase n=1 Tax=Aquimarina callyspongiae TaxID=3098150 RepID=UPI002AB4E2B1|nr:type II CAAX endopeptidase family protein [Aquimarina sp. 2201CG5-10]MDY8135515.1 type II CAAX endopeptidase family protein [Aquimarina sp. 2201CG5-10]